MNKNLPKISLTLLLSVIGLPLADISSPLTEIFNDGLTSRFLYQLDIFQEGKLEMADEIIASDFVWRNPIIPSELQDGLESVKKIALQS